MSDPKLLENLMQLGAGVQACLDKRLSMPALILLYSAIDITSWLASGYTSSTVRERFTSWVDQYLLSAKRLGCTSLELYSARCGIVHTFTPDSQLANIEGIRRVAYAWGSAKSVDLQTLIEKTNWTDRLVAVHVEELFEGWRLGALAFVNELQENPKRAEMVKLKARKFFDHLAADSIESLHRKE